jgi:hypothetical protein
MSEFLYAVLLFLVLRFSVTLFNFLSNPKLGHYGKHFTDRVSILVLLPNSVADTDRLLKAIAGQDYKELEVLIQTPGVSVKELVGQCTGKYLLFLAENSSIHYSLINNLICRAKTFNLALLSIIPNYKHPNWLARCISPLNDFILLNILPLRLVRLSSSQAFVSANSDCLFFDAKLYKDHGWHEFHQLRSSGALELMKAVKREKFPVEVLLGNQMVEVSDRVWSWKTTSGKLLMTLGNQPLIALVYILLVIIGPVAIGLYFDPMLWMLPIGLIFLSRMMISFLTAQSPIWNVLLHPLQMICLFVLMLRGMAAQILTAIKH